MNQMINETAGAAITRATYEDRLRRVTDYIHDHLDEELDLMRLAEVACMSPYHWHRVYRAVHGETIAATVKRMRLHRAAGDLANTDMPVEDVAMRCGYPNQQSFTRIFAAVYGMPPAQYRTQGSHTRFRPKPGERASHMHHVTIKTIPAMTATTLKHRGSYMQIDKTYDSLMGTLAQRGLLTPETMAGMRMVAVFPDDPDATPEPDLCSFAGVVTPEPLTAEPPLEHLQITGGQYAVLRHQGPYADMKAAYHWFYGQWLPQSGRDAANAPGFEEYLNNPRETAPADLLSDIHLPLA